MGRPDSTAQGALGQRVTRPVWFLWLDFADGAIRATTLPHNVTLISSDPELNGQAFGALEAKVQEFGQVHQQEGGSETVTISLSGQLLPNVDLMNKVANRTNWQGRGVKFWQGIVDENAVFTGNIWLYHAGWMSSLSMGGGAKMQTITLSIEGYLALFGRASQRTYMDQTLIDAGDLSPRLITASSSPGSGSGGVPGVPGPTGGGRGGFLDVWR